MRFESKLPVGLIGISRMMEMQSEEVRAWPFYTEVQGLFKDYNKGFISKPDFISRLRRIAERCNNSKLFAFYEGLNNAISAVELVY